MTTRDDIARLLYCINHVPGGHRVLAETLQRFRKCLAPDCSRVFVAWHRRRYCSTRCQKREYMRKRRAALAIHATARKAFMSLAPLERRP